jgi:hypothetical protein
MNSHADAARSVSPQSKWRGELFAIAVLRQFFRVDYRGIAAILEDSSDLREVLGLRRVPHFSTLAYAEKRIVQGLSHPCCGLCRRWRGRRGLTETSRAAQADRVPCHRGTMRPLHGAAQGAVHRTLTDRVAMLNLNDREDPASHRRKLGTPLAR